MAGSNQVKKVAGSPREDVDPIAELSDIMKFDPQGYEASGEGGKVEVDLESELLGEFAHDELSTSGAVESSVGAAPAGTDEFDDGFDAALSEAFDEHADVAGAGNSTLPATSDEQRYSEESPTSPFETDSRAVGAVAGSARESRTAPAVPPELESQLHALLAGLDAGYAVEEAKPGAAAAEQAHRASGAHAAESDWRRGAGHADSARGFAETARTDAGRAPDDARSRDAQQEDRGDAARLHQGSPEPAEDRQLAGTNEDLEIAVAEEPESVDEPEGVAGAPVEFEEAEVQAAQPQEKARPPEIETLALPDEVEPLGDDLDIPEVEFEKETPPRPDFLELDAEFASAFKKLTEFEHAMKEESATVPDRQASMDRGERRDGPGSGAATGIAATAVGPVVMAHADRPQPQPGAESYAEADDWDMADLGDDDPFHSRGAEDDDFFAGVPSEEEMRDSGRRRGVLIAAVVATIAVAGGIGAFALSFGGGDETAGPALVKADEDPIKVKPKDPGGATAPNEDKAVYDRVAGMGEEEEPTQEKLISTAEEPIDVENAGSRPRIVLPASGDSDLAGTLPKADDRILPEENAAASEEAEEFVAVEPRRVKTLIVRPDGTMVERAIEQSPAIAEGLRAAIAGGEAVAADEDGAVPLPAAGEEAVEAPDEGAVVESAETGDSLAPAEEVAAAEPDTVPSDADSSGAPAAAATTTGETPVPREAEASAAREVEAEEPVATTALAAPQPAAADVEWWVQISSQPSRELAQASYAEIAGRHGSIIGDRAVNIYPAQIEGKGTYYRVRVAGGSRGEATELCARLKGAGANCFVAR